MSVELVSKEPGSWRYVVSAGDPTAPPDTRAYAYVTWTLRREPGLTTFAFRCHACGSWDCEHVQDVLIERKRPGGANR